MKGKESPAASAEKIAFATNIQGNSRRIISVFVRIAPKSLHSVLAVIVIIETNDVCYRDNSVKNCRLR
jgi:hypothetical protein